MIDNQLVNEYNADSIKILDHDEAIERWFWVKAGELATQYSRLLPSVEHNRKNGFRADFKRANEPESPTTSSSTNTSKNFRPPNTTG